MTLVQKITIGANLSSCLVLIGFTIVQIKTHKLAKKTHDLHRKTLELVESLANRVRLLEQIITPRN